MTWSYTGNPADSDKDAVRFWCGDTDSTDELVQDEEIAYVLTLQPEVKLAAADVCDAIAAELSRQADKRVGDVQESMSQRAIAFEALATKLRNRAASLASPKFGGLSISEKETLDQDRDAVQPSFRIGQGDHPGLPFDRGGGSFEEGVQ